MITRQPLPARLLHHRGVNSQWTIRTGDIVPAGAPIQRGERWQHAAATCVVAHCDADTARLDVIDDTPPGPEAPLDVNATSASDLLRRVHEAGIAGLGGGGYPTHLKLLTAARHGVHTLVINAMECEPGISCDAALSAEGGREIQQGINAVRRILAINTVTLAAASTMQVAMLDVDTRHIRENPSATDGAERYLLRDIFNVILTPGEYPVHHGFVVCNIGTLHAIGRAISGHVLTERVTTVFGDNRWLPIGLPLSELVRSDTARVGGRLSGHVVRVAGAMVDKTTNGIDTASTHMALPCIRCGRCDDACPEHLPVTGLLTFSAPPRVGTLERLGLANCVECGLCNPACPSDIDVLATLRDAKTTLIAERQRRSATALANTRATAHTHRLATQAEQREQRRRDRLARLRGATSD
ncbi:MAG: 4Fe-4S dicluster domain-containing protein [Pseudomonadales bacterium]|nr:4Fe-4S dicluster domain-containing protein [Pseudomonadales bacterium]MCP5182408.1 4Fe-4S dicluster domain-containing protein [Pseudomonadales bacterium]